jgi:hypothetical protein
MKHNAIKIARSFFCCVALLISLLSSMRLAAQEISGSISGSVRDPGGAVVANATVIATRAETASSVSTKTNDVGLYSFPNLPIGAYQLTTEASGFKKYIGTGLILNVNAHLELDIVLQVGSVTESVEITAGSAAVDTETAQVGNLINGDQVKQLPLNGRNFVALTTLTPGTTPGSGFNTFDVGLLGGTALSVNGNASNGNLWLVNGVTNLDVGSNATLMVFPSVDSISEFSILRNNYSAEFGFAAGGIVNVVTKSGGQSFHGSLFEFIRNDKFDAEDYFLHSAGLPKNELRFNNFGWTLGGPIFIPHGYNADKKKDFFFVAQEWRREVQGGTVVMNVPTTRQRLGILDPTCTNGSPAPCVVQPADPKEINSLAEPNVAPYCVAGVTVPCITAPGQTPAPGTTPFVPDPNAVAELARYPLPNTNGAPNFTGSRPARTKWREDSARWDHYFTDRSNLMLNWIHDTWAQDNTALWGDAPNPAIASDWSQPSNAATARLTHIWSQHLLGTIQFSYSDNDISWVSSKSCPTSLCSRQGFTYSEIYPETNGQFPTLLGTGEGFTTLEHLPPYSNRTDIVQLTPNMDYVFGKHTLKFGGQVAWLRKPAPSQADDPTAGSFFATDLHDFLFGQLAEYSEIQSQNNVPTRWRNEAIYVQDNYKAFSNLTLNLGLRWQVLGQPYSAANNIANFFPNLWNAAQAPTLDANGNVIVGTGNPINGLIMPKSSGAFSQALAEQHYNEWEPRVGFSYDPLRKGNFVIRGGFGIYHSQDSVDHLVNLGQNPPFNGQSFLFGTTFSAIGPIPPGTPEPSLGLMALDRNRADPTSYQYSGGFQFAPVKNTTLEVDYVGSHEIHIGRNLDINQVLPADQLAVFNGAPPSLFRPYTGYQSIILNEREAFARYNSLQVFLNHRMSHGLQLQMAYTMSHSFGDASNEQNGAAAQPIQDAYHPERDQGWTNIDQPQSFTLNYVWSIPFAKGQRGVSGVVLDGWQLAGIYTLASGTPTTPCLLGDNAGIGSFGGCERPNVIGSIPGPRTVKEYFNPAAFALPSAGTFGDARVNSIRQPGYNNLDFSIYKNFNTHWRESQIQFRAEFFNFLNHTQFSALDTAFGDPAFGSAVATRSPRDVQFGLKYLF